MVTFLHILCAVWVLGYKCIRKQKVNKIVFVNVPLSLQGTVICPICILQSLLYIIHLLNLLICNRIDGSVACSSMDDTV